MAWMADLVVDFGRPLLNFVRAFVGTVPLEREEEVLPADETGKPSVLSVKIFDWLKTGTPQRKVAVEGEDGFVTYTPGEGFEFTEFDEGACAPGVALVLPPCVTQGRPAEIEILVEPLTVAARVVGSCGDKVFLDRRVSNEETKSGVIRAKIPSFKEHCVVDVLLIPVVEESPCQCKVVPVCVLPEAAAEGLHSIFFQMVDACEKTNISQGDSLMKRRLETCKGVWKNNFSDFINDLEAFMVGCSGPEKLEADEWGEELLELFQRMLECSIHYKARGFALFLVARAVDGGIEVTGAEELDGLGQEKSGTVCSVGASHTEGNAPRDSVEAEVKGGLESVRSLSHNDSAFIENAHMSIADAADSNGCPARKDWPTDAERPSSMKPTGPMGRGGGERGFIGMLMDSANSSPMHAFEASDHSKYNTRNDGMGCKLEHGERPPLAGAKRGKKGVKEKT